MVCAAPLPVCPYLAVLVEAVDRPGIGIAFVEILDFRCRSELWRLIALHCRHSVSRNSCHGSARTPGATAGVGVPASGD
jgi:hypothetical protein